MNWKEKKWMTYVIKKEKFMWYNVIYKSNYYFKIYENIF